MIVGCVINAMSVGSGSGVISASVVNTCSNVVLIVSSWHACEWSESPC